jgi:hypothetical protein
LNPAPILATLLRLSLWHGDATEDPIARAERLQDIAVAIAGASSSRDEAAFLLTLGEAETRFAAYTRHPETCVLGPRGMRCDQGRAYGYWSLHRRACTALHGLPLDDPRTVYVGATCAIQLYRFGRFTCGRGDDAGIFNVYAGNSCSKGPGAARANRMAQIRAMLNR